MVKTPYFWRSIAVIALIGLASCSDTPSDSALETQMDFVAGDVPLGDPNAPVKLIEYASLTCTHCRDFHKNVLPHLKTEFIDTGKAVLILREFPTGPVALSTAQTMLTRCSGAEHYHDMVSAFFDKQYEIIEKAQTIGALGILTEIAAEHGLDQDGVEACLDNAPLRDSIKSGALEAQAKGVQSTPTLFINDQRVSANDNRLIGLRALIQQAVEEAKIPSDDKDSSIESGSN